MVSATFRGMNMSQQRWAGETRQYHQYLKDSCFGITQLESLAYLLLWRQWKPRLQWDKWNSRLGRCPCFMYFEARCLHAVRKLLGGKLTTSVCPGRGCFLLRATKALKKWHDNLWWLFPPWLNHTPSESHCLNLTSSIASVPWSEIDNFLQGIKITIESLLFKSGILKFVVSYFAP